MNYWQFRLSCYRHELAQLLAQLKQLSLGLVNLFPLAMPALVMMPLVVLALLADPQTPAHQYLTALWAYQLLLHSWLLLQQKAIKAQKVSDYVTSLPVSNGRQRITELGLILYAAHLLLLAPWLMLFGLLLRHASHLTSQPILVSLSQFLPVLTLALLSLYYSWAAVYRRYPWLSLLLAPLLMLPFASELTVAQLVGIWLLAIAVEQLMTFHQLPQLNQPRGLVQLQLAADLTTPKAQLLRLVMLLLLLMLADSFLRYSSEVAQPYISSFFSLLMGIWLGAVYLC